MRGLRGVVTFASIGITGWFGFMLVRWGAQFAMPLFPAGIALAAVYRWGRRMGWSIAAASATSQIAMGHTPWNAVVSGVGVASGALVSDWLLKRARFDPGFARARDLPIFVSAAVAGMTVAPTVGLAGFLLAGTGYLPGLLRWVRWWCNGVGGVLLVAPALLAMNRQSLRRLRTRWPAGLAWLLGLSACCGVIVFAPGPVGRSIMVMFALMLVVVAAIEFGLVVSTVGALIIAYTAALGFDFGVGMFGHYAEWAGRLTMLLFGATLAGASLVITALLAERDTEAVERLHAQRRYAQIFDGSPQPIWVHDPCTRRFLLVNDAAQRLYGWTRAELLGMTIDLLAPPGETRLVPASSSDGQTGAILPFEARHATRDGRILAVDVWMRSIDFGGGPSELVFALDVSERRALAKALIDGLASERQRIAGEFHDGLGQELTGLALSLRALATRAERDRQAVAGDLDDLAKLAARCIEGSQRMVQGLSPLSDAGGSLEKALQGLARRASLSGTPVRFNVRGRAPPAARLQALDHIYRIAQEAVQNALKHAAAASIDIELWSDKRVLGLAVIDDGCGLPSDPERTGLGMRTMHFRASAIGGTLSIQPGAGGGTAVRCEAPLVSVDAQDSQHEE